MKRTDRKTKKNHASKFQRRKYRHHLTQSKKESPKTVNAKENATKRVVAENKAAYAPPNVHAWQTVTTTIHPNKRMSTFRE